ncbi:unnamed protein product [Orchesella dallaii]
MVHKANSRKDVSRSHSWIYGSVKLPSDLPFGYGEAFSFDHNNSEEGDCENSGEVMTMTMEQVEREHQRGGGGHYLHTHAVQAMQIPRCQLDYFCTCDCGGGNQDFDMVLMSSSGRPLGPGGSVRGGRKGRSNGTNNNGPCQGCAREMAMKYGLPSSSSSSSKHRKNQGGGGATQSSESFVSSVRKLTWKSLKQVVKKRPSIETLKKMPMTHHQQMQSQAQQQILPEFLSAPIVPMPFLSPGALSGNGGENSKNPLANLSGGSTPSHYGNPRLNSSVVSYNNGAILNSSPNNSNHQQMLIASPLSSSSSSSTSGLMSHNPNGNPNEHLPEQGVLPQNAPNYFFPEKKGFYSSCNDIYGDEPPPHVTASVRVRPKRTRQPYEFPSEFGPVPNYEEEAQQLYHSEWDLRQVMSYDVWMSTTSHVKPRTESGALTPGSTKSSSGTKSRSHPHSNSSGNIHVPPPDYPPPEPLNTTSNPNPSNSSTFRPQSRSSSASASATAPISEKISTTITSGGSVKMPGTNSRSSRASLASLQSNHSSKSSSTSSSSSKSTAKNSQSSLSSTDTLTISSFANNPKKESKNNGNPIIKRSSILAADVSAYQLLKQQTKKQLSGVKSVQQPSQLVKQPIKPVITVPQPATELDDAFSESSDDLSDNAITGSASNTSNSNQNGNASKSISNPASSVADEAAKRGRVRIAGQGIRMALNNNNNNNISNRNKNQKGTTVSSAPAPPPPKSRGESSNNPNSSRTSTFSSYQTQNHQQQAQSSQTKTTKTTNMVLITRKETNSSGSDDEDDVWSDCHTDLPYYPQQNMKMMMEFKNELNQNQNQHVATNTNSKSISSLNSTLASTQPQPQREHQSKGVSMRVNGETVVNKNTMIVSANNGNNNHRNNHHHHQDNRSTFVTFEKPPVPKHQQQLPQQKQSQNSEESMEFEEYEFDQGGRAKEEQKTQVKLGNKTGTISNSNVVSLNVPRNPMANTNSNHPPNLHQNHHNHHPTYIKHSKGSQSSSSAAATGKFGALRRRKSRNGGAHNPGKLLQETIYEEELEHVDERDNLSGNQSISKSSGLNSKGHAVKIMVSTTSSPGPGALAPVLPTSTQIQSVKPILKNRERTYETPVINITNNNGISSSSSCISNDNNFTGLSSSSSSSSFTKFESASNNNSNSNGNNDIYFDSSVSTVSTASKKKVQFDSSKLVVCGGDSEENCSEEYDDDSDQWSAKSDEEEEEEQRKPEEKSVTLQNQNQQRKSEAFEASGNNDEDRTRTGLVDIDNGNGTGAFPNGNNSNQSQNEEQSIAASLAKAKARTSFEEEVARKAASFAKSRQAAEEQRKKKEKELKEKSSNHNHDDIDVNNLLLQNKKKETASLVVYGGCRTTGNGEEQQQQEKKMKEQQNQVVVIPRISTVNVSRNNNINSNTNSNINNGSKSKHQQQQQQDSHHLNNKRNSCTTNNRENSQRSNDRNGGYQDCGETSIQWDSEAEIFKNGNNQRVINPNSLLFHDTTRIRLQSRPALQENTFNSSSSSSPSSGGPGKGVNGRLTRLKQSNSFRSVSSMPLRPREPPPPPPPQSGGLKQHGHGLASVVPSRLQKALSTSTLLSKSTEKLHQLSLSSSSSSSSPTSKSNGNVSHYGVGGKLLPSKSQISLPLDFTTTSNQATKAVGIVGSVETLNLAATSTPTSTSKSSIYQKQNTSSSPSNSSQKTPSAIKSNKYQRASSSSSSSSTRSLANRSKSLTDKCEALEKVLNSSKRSPNYQPGLSLSRDNLSVSPQQPLKPSGSLPHLPTLTPPLPPQDMDSKNIEIVTKENDVSEIRIYSTSSVSNFNLDEENLPYQGIIYESTKTLITTTNPTNSDEKPNSSSNGSHPEIHYAATDLFPSPPIPNPTPTPQVAAPSASAPQSEFETSGKSVVLIIDNSKTPNKKGKSPLTYSQPIDTISKSKLGGVRALPQIPPPKEKTIIKAKQIPPETEIIYGGSHEPESEPLYDDVINHIEPPARPPPPKIPQNHNNNSSLKNTTGVGSLGRKSLSTKGKEYKILPPHQLGELPPLPPPPVPPHRTLTLPPLTQSSVSSSGQVVSSTLPCPACPPSLPPPNLPSKNLSEFHNRPLVIQESEEDYLEESSVTNNGFSDNINVNMNFRQNSSSSSAPISNGNNNNASNSTSNSQEDLEQEVDNLYNDIGTPTMLSSPSPSGLVIGQHVSASSSSSTMKSSTAAAFASAMKEAFLGAIKSMEFDRRSVHSSSSSSAGSTRQIQQQNGEHLNFNSSELIYDDTATALVINHSNSSGSKMQHAPLPQLPQNKTLVVSSPLNSKQDGNFGEENERENRGENEEKEEEHEPLYDDVLNLTQMEKTKEIISQNQNQNQLGGEYLSSNSSDSGTEDLPPPLPTQGPPPLTKVADFHFPLLPSIPLESSLKTSIETSKVEGKLMSENENVNQNESEDSSEKDVLDRTRSLLNELNEKLSKLNFTPEPSSSSSSASSTSPGASSFSSTSSSGVDSGEKSLSFKSHLAPGDFSTYISKVVISPSSESSGVEEDYNSEKNYSLSNGSDAASSSDENYKMSQVSKLVSETISLARGKFLENMKLSMLNGNTNNGAQNHPNNNNNQDNSSVGPGLLMMSTEKKKVGEGENCPKISSSTSSSSIRNNNRNNGKIVIEEEEDEPIYEEIGDNHPKQEVETCTIGNENDNDDNEEDRSTSPVYADAFDAKSMFDGASRNDILSFLESIRDRLTGAESTSSSESQSSSISSKKEGKFLEIVERNDSGIGSESSSLLTSTSTSTSKNVLEISKLNLPTATANSLSSSSSASERSSSPPEIEKDSESSPCPSLKQLCSDCNHVDLGLEEETGGSCKEHHHNHHHLSSSSSSSEDLKNSSTSASTSSSFSGRGVCRSCNRKRNEKKEIIMEIYETELKYGRDLRIISEEFYKPIQIAGLLAKEQLDQIFLNVDELSQINLELTSRLKMAIHKSTNANSNGETSTGTNKKSDDDLSDVNVGKIFLQLGESMMTAFENYCTRQASAGALLSQLEKEKELLRIFLRVSQMENTVLRRMNLPAFLMVPVQRVTRYPLLLSRLVKVTPPDHFSRDELQLAQEKIEQHLEHMNKTTREVASVKLWRRISIINGNSNSSNNNAPVHRRSNSDLDTSNIRIRKMAMDVMDWSNFNDVTCVIDNQLGSVHFNGKTMRNIYGCLLARGKDLDLLASKMDQDLFFPPAEDVVKDVKLVLVRVKNTRFCLLREPLCLSKCVVSQGENEFQDFIEINEITTKNTYFIQGLDKQSTGTWLKFLQCYSSCVGHWRRRRPALANIMMNGMIKHL